MEEESWDGRDESLHNESVPEHEMESDESGGIESEPVESKVGA